MRLEYVAEKAQGRNKTSCDVRVSVIMQAFKTRYSYCKERLVAKRQQGCT